MPRPVKTIEDYCKEAADRHSMSELDRQRLHTYAVSLDRRWSEVQHALHEIGVAAVMTDSPSTSEHLTGDDLLRNRCTIFWTLAYSLFDIFASAANVIYGIATDERQVAFKRITPSTWSNAHGLSAEVARITKSKCFKRLDAYRNCVLHRRAVQISKTTTRNDRAYLSYDSTDEETIEWIVVVNPDRIGQPDPRTTPLLEYCNKTANTVRTDLIKLLKKL